MKGRLRVPSVCAAILLFTSTASNAGSTRNPATPGGRYLVLIVIDGFRPDYMALARMANLRSLMATGTTYSRAWVGQLETETPTSHATLATGVYPRKHGVIGFVWRDPTGQNIVWMPSNARADNSGAMEKLIEAGGVPTISDLLHQHFPGAKSASLSGEKFYAADAMGTGADYILYGKGLPNRIVVTPIGRHVPPSSVHYQKFGVRGVPQPNVQDQFVARLAVHLVQTVRPRMLLVNLPGTDIEGHRSGGPDAPNALRIVARGADKAIGRIVAAYKRAGLYSRTDFVVTADHAMLPNSHLAPVHSIAAGVRQTGTAWLEDDLLSTAGYIYLRNPQDAGRVAESLVAHHYPHIDGALYKVQDGSGFSFRADPATAQRLGPRLTSAFLDLSDTIASFSGPDIVLPYAEDTLGLDGKVPGHHWGTHGGLSWRVQHIPLVISGPGVHHSTSRFPAQMVDIAPTIERLLGLPIPKGIDGVVLADALRNAGARDIAGQTRVESARSRDVSALMQHSEQQHGVILKAK